MQNESERYSKFCLEYLGYDFICRKTGKRKRRSEVFWRINRDKIPVDRIANYYDIVDTEGWKDGIMTEQEKSKWNRLMTLRVL